MKLRIEAVVETEQIPRMVTVTQLLDSIHLEDPVGQLRSELKREPVVQSIRPGMRIAITAGSREIDNGSLFLRELVSFVKECGAQPFLIPAMGSHGGATAKGQMELLRSLGITEDSVGAPINASMEVTHIGDLADGRPVYLDRYAAEADGIILFNRVKPHTAFHGAHESGLYKMMAIGLGKQYGAAIVHGEGSSRMGENIQLFGEYILHHTPVLFGVACTENAVHKTKNIVVFTHDEITYGEKELLCQVKASIPGIPFQNLDLLIIDEIGKDISGLGMDPNVTYTYTPESLLPTTKRANRIAILDITEKSHGCANGIGMADTISIRAYKKYDQESTYMNAITAHSATVAKVPMTFQSDKLAIQAAIALGYGSDKKNLRAVRISNTLKLERFQISEALIPEALEIKGLRIYGEPEYLDFDKEGNLF